MKKNGTHDKLGVSPDGNKEILYSATGREENQGIEVFHRLFEEQAKQTPGSKSVICGDESLTYEELNRSTDTLAGELVRRGMETGEVAALLCRRGINFLISVIGIFKAGAAYLPLDPLHPSERQLHILRHSRTKFVITGREFKKHMEEVLRDIPGEEKPLLLVIEEVSEESMDRKEDVNLPVSPRPGELAYVIYTSGSTGKPKGAMVEQKGMVNHLFAKVHDLKVTGQDRIVQNASQCFDISVWQYLCCLLGGGCVYIVSDEIAHDPDKLLRYTEEHKITLLEVVPSLLQAMLEGIETGRMEKPGLKSLRWMIVTGEALRPGLAGRWFHHYGHIPLLNAYGPTECSDDVTHYFLYGAPPGGMINMPIGKAIINTRLYVMKEEGEGEGRYMPCKVGEAGELWVSGVCVGRGYLNDVLLTARAFRGGIGDIGEARVYRTGDLVRMLGDGNIEFLGRIDRQVKVQGFRVELGEIESLVTRYPGVKDCVVKAVDMVGQRTNLVARQPVKNAGEKGGGHKRLVAYFISERHHPTSGIREYLSRHLPYYMVPTQFIKMDFFPLNANGKIDYQRLPAPEEARPNLESDYIPPGDDIEKKLVEAWEEVLKVPGIGIQDNFFEVGGDSLLGMQILNRIRTVLQVDIPYKTIYEKGTVEEIAQYIRQEKRRGEYRVAPLRANEVRDRYPLTYAQKRIWFVCQMQPGNPFYNFAGILYIKGKYHREAFHRAWLEILRRHIILNTRFCSEGGIPYQRFDHKEELEIPGTDLRGEAGAERSRVLTELATEESQVPFDLEVDRLIRFRLYLLSESEYAVLLVMHEIILDGWGTCVLLKEFGRLYDGYLSRREVELSPLKVEFKDFAIWEDTYQGKEVWREHEKYWRWKLSGELPVLALPFDYARPPALNYRGDSVGMVLDEELSGQIRRLAEESKVTLFTVLSAGYKLLLHYYSGQEDILVGSPIVNRNSKETENMVGFQINMVTFRTDLSGDPSFKELLGRESESISEAISHAEYPFIELLEAINPVRDTTVSPIFQVMFNMLNFPYSSEELGNLELYFREIETQYTKYDISFYGQEQGGQIYLQFSYLLALFRHRTIVGMMRNFATVLKSVVKEPLLKVSQVEFLSEEERDILVKQFNRVESYGLGGEGLVRIFRDQVMKKPDGAAYIFADRVVTYKELDQRSGGAACYLEEKGCRAGELVGFYSERSLELLVGLWGILKLGAAYVPLEPAYPPTVLQGIAADVRMRHVVIGEGGEGIDFPVFGGEKIYLDRSETQGEAAAALTLTIKNAGTGGVGELFNVLYTSSSTGKAKGVMISRRAVLNRLAWMWREYPFEGRDVVLLHKSFALVGTSWELLGGLLGGVRTLSISREDQQDVEKLCGHMLREQVSYFHTSPPLIKELQEYIGGKGVVLRWLRIVTTSAEPVSPQLVMSWNRSVPGAPLLNLYGLTECSSNITQYDTEGMEEGCRNVPLGRPLDNIRIDILNGKMKLSPIGAVGEICVSGACTALGYLNNPGLTAEKFIPRTTGGGGILFRTGDFGRWSAEGNLEYTGRRDEQVKVYGYRVELLEVERSIEKHPGVKKAAVAAVESRAGNKELVAFVVGAENLNVSGIRSFLGELLPTYMIPTHYVKLEDLPLTANGKVDKKNLPLSDALMMEIGNEYCAPRDEIEEKMAGIWERVLEREGVGIRDNFFDIGGHSLRAAQVSALMQKQLGVQVPLRMIFEYPTIAGLAEKVKESLEKREEEPEAFVSGTIVMAEEKEYYELSPAQRRLYIIWQMEEKTIAYNRPMAMILEGEINIKVLERVFNELIERHESLRTGFIMVGEKAVQRVYEEVEFAIEHYETTERDPVRIIEEFIRPFDISRAPLLRVGLVKSGERTYILIVDIHHITADGTSQQILNQEFTALYDRDRLPLLSIRYRDYVEWRNRVPAKGGMSNQEAYWVKEFAGEIPVLNMPYDYPRPVMQGFEGGSVIFDIGVEASKALNEMARSEGTTLFVVILVIYTIFLSKLSGQEDIVVGVPTAGRGHAELEKVIGMFVNTLAMRNFPGGEKGIKTFLEEAKEKAINGFDNQDYPFEELVEKVPVERDMSRNPLFDVMFAFQNFFQEAANPDVETGGLKIKPYPYENKTSKFDLSMFAQEMGGVLYFRFEYSTKLFTETTVERFSGYFKQVIKEVTGGGTERRLAEIEIIPGAERERIIYEFNKTGMDYPREKSIHRLFEEEVERRPGHVALVGPKLQKTKYKLQTTNNKRRGALRPDVDAFGEVVASDGGVGLPVRPVQPVRPVSLTYHELNEQSNRLSGLLMKRGVHHDVIVGIVMERSVEMVIGILGILKAGGAYMPIDPGYPQERIDYMLKDSGAKVLVTTNVGSAHARTVGKLPLQLINLEEGLPILPSTLTLPPPRQVRPANLAYIIYTSGTTGRPKGVLVEQSSVVNLLYVMQNLYPIGEGEVYLLKTSYVFDVSVAEIFGWYMGGGRIAILEEEGHKDSLAILDAIKRNRVTHINFVPSMFHVFLEQVSTGGVLELSSLKYIFLAGEELLPRLVERFRDFNTSIILENIYGPTESTVYASKYSLSSWNGSESIPIGRPFSNVRLYILNKNGDVQPLGAAGELCIGGRGLARGYLNRPVLTAEKFEFLQSGLEIAPRPLHRSPFTHALRLYRTGDLAKWQPDGNIEFLGRIDHQVKIRGYRIELGEIVNRLLEHRKIREAFVLAKEDMARDKYLAVYFVSDIDISALELKEYLLKYLPDYMIPAYFIRLEKIPVTPSGKIDRKALPAPGMTARGSYVAPRNPVEEKLAEIWSEVLGRESLPASSIGIDDNFFRLGGHSLKAMLLIARIHKEFHADVPLMEIFKKTTLRDLADYISKSEEYLYTPIEPVETKEYYVLSSTQKRLYALYQLAENSTGYNMPFAALVEGELEKDKPERTFLYLLKKHESLRTSFFMLSGEPLQKVHHDVKFEIEYYNYNIATGNTGGLEAVIHGFIRPFDFSKAPLFRVGLIRELPQRYILLVDMHHIISDGISQRILLKEFIALYGDNEFSSLRLQYKDFAEWQRSDRHGETLLKQEVYWKKQFEDEIPVLELPTDYTRPSVQQFEGRNLIFETGQEELQALNALAKEQGATLYMILLTVYTIFLSKITGQEDIVVGTPTAGRRHADLEGIIGMFVNTLALRNYPVGAKTFKVFLNEIKKRALEAFENQDYQYENLIEQLPLPRDLSRNPLFDVMLVLQNMDAVEIEIPGLKLSPLRFESKISKFDLMLSGVEAENKLSFSFEYSTKLFREATIERFIGYFKRVVAGITHLEKKDIELWRIEILADEEKKRILYDFNAAEVEYPKNKTIHRLFEEQVKKTPDYAALVGPKLPIANHKPQTNSPGQITGKKIGPPLAQQDTAHGDIIITYNELSGRSGKLARLLIEKGVQPDTIVGIMMERSVDMVIGILGILKSGGAYLPIAIDYPQERIDYMLKDSNAKLVVNQNFFGGSRPPAGLPYHRSSFIVHLSSHLAYIIYTSGSTGKPKGVMVEHGPVVNLLSALHHRYPLLEQDTYLLKTSYLFDVSVTELFGWFLEGGRLAILQPGGEKYPKTIQEMIVREGVTHINFVPSMFQTFVEVLDTREIARLRGLKYIFLAGEALPTVTVKRSRQTIISIAMENIYGPTEAVVYASWYSLAGWKDEASIPIGKPLPNVTLYILDQWNHFQPIGVVGELCIGGIGLARGYLNKLELTAEKFVMTNDSPHKYSTNDRLYKTGDLARWRLDGNIEFLGRIDRQVKIRGFRVELGEIENRLLEHDGIKEVVVVIRTAEQGDKYLCAYFVAKSPQPGKPGYSIKESGLREYLLSGLPGYMVPSYFVPMETLPLTPNGKIDRKALPGPGLKASDNYEAPRDRIEKKLVNLWSEVLGIEKEKIGINDNFFHLGGHSLKATILAARIHKELTAKVPWVEIFKTPHIRGLAAFIKNAETQRFFSIEAVEKKEFYILSSAQRRLSVLQQMDEKGIAYNMPSVWQLEGVIDIEKFEAAFQQSIRRHESLRTSFHVANDMLVQVVHDEVEFAIEYDWSMVNGQWSLVKCQGRGEVSSPLIDSFIRPFVLSKAPLFRVGLIEQEKQKNILMVDMHHIISDGMSIGILVREFMELYSGKGLPALKLQYKDYSEWQHRQSIEKPIKQQEVYWLKEFSGEIPVLDLPTDYSRPSVRDFAGSSISFEIGGEETNALKSLANEQGVTLFMLVLSIYTACLSRLSGQEEIVVGTPIAGRRHADLEPLMGMFVNTLALRNFPDRQKSFIQFSEEVKENTLKAFENQDYLYEDLVEQVNPERDTARNPLFDTMFALRNFEALRIEIPGLKVQPIENETRISKFDLTLTAVEAEKNLLLAFEYCTKLFKQETIDRFIGYFIKTITVVIHSPGIKISGIEIIEEEEKNRILHEFNDTAAAYPKEKTIHRLFEEQAERTPDNIALHGGTGQKGALRAGIDAFGGITASDDYEAIPVRPVRSVGPVGPVQLTYRELNEKSNRLAGLLIENSVQPDAIVGIMIERSVEMVIGILAILKAGGAYLPIDPEYPEERKQYILKDSGAKVLLSEMDYLNCQLPIANRQLLMISPGGTGQGTVPKNPLIGSPRRGPAGSRQPAASLAYIIYTSGSTGRPKGVLVEHHSVNRLVKNTGYIEFKDRDRILQTGALSFDASTFEIWGALLNGLGLVLLPKERIMNPETLKWDLHLFAISTLWMTAPLFNQIANADKEVFAGLGNLLVGGDVLSTVHIDRIRKKFPGLNIINGYGPTENTTFSTTYLIDKDYGERIPIGKPIANSTAYIVDKNGNFQPIGIAGEIWVGGDGTARGYLNDPGLTAEKFVIGQSSFVIKKLKRAVIGHSSFVIDRSTNDRLYKTGDLARWQLDGNIEFLGRIDHQVKIRGFRVELGEIENRLLEHDGIKEVVVVIRTAEQGDKYLCAYFVSESPQPGKPGYSIKESELREYLLSRLPGYMVPSYFVPLDTLPLTPNGKIDRKAFPLPVLKASDNYEAPRDGIEEKLVDIWAGVLGIEKEKIGIDDSFFHLGGHSLKATILVTRIHKELKVNVPLAEIFKTSQIRGLAAFIKNAETQKSFSIEAVEKKEYYILSSTQRRLLVLQQMDKNGIAYNIPTVWQLEGDIDGEKIESVFQRLIRRHESLRTSFHVVNDMLVQVVHDEVEFAIEYDWSLVNGQWPLVKCQGRGEVSSPLIDSFIRPFVLSKAPLFRVGLIEQEKQKNILMVDMHHIISDGTSIGVLVKEFMQYYGGNEPEPLRMQYKDYVEWQLSEKEKKSIIKQERYWIEEYKGKLPFSNLPLDYKRPAVQSFEGSSLGFEIGAEDTNAMKRMAGSESITLYMVMLSVYYVFLSKLSGQEDIIVGTPVAGRRDTDLDNIVGMFVNTLALRNFPKGELTFREFLQEVKKRTLDAFENQEYPFEELLDKVRVKRDKGRNPLFDTVFVLQNIEIPRMQIPGLELSPYNFESKISKFDLVLTGFENKENLTFTFQYCTALFKENTIRKYIGFFLKIISIIRENPGIMISRIEILSEEEKNRMVLNSPEEQESSVKDFPLGTFAGPRTDMEKKVSIIWSKVLGTGNIDVTLDFFQLGGNSIKALLLILELNEAFDTSLQIMDVFDHLTVEKLAALLNERFPGAGEETKPLTVKNVEGTIFNSYDDNLVILKKVSTTANHLFFIHDGTGEVGGYIKFCNLLKIGLNCWGIQSDRIKNCAPVDLSVSDLAKHYIEKIKTIRSTGPYNIAGWSTGGSIAFEMALQLEKKNEKVSFLGIIDSLPPSKSKKLLTREFSKRRELNLLKKSFANPDELWERLKNQGEMEDLWSEVTGYLESVGFDIASFRKIIKEKYRIILPDSLRFNHIREGISLLNWIRTLINAAQRYIPGNKIKAPVHYFGALQSFNIKKEKWKKYTAGTIKYYKIVGDHRSIFDTPFVEDFAGTFGCVIEKLFDK